MQITWVGNQSHHHHHSASAVSARTLFGSSIIYFVFSLLIAFVTSRLREAREKNNLKAECESNVASIHHCLNC